MPNANKLDIPELDIPLQALRAPRAN